MPLRLIVYRHDRLVIGVALWLGEKEGDLPGLMKSCPDDWLRMWKVANRVGNVKNNDAELIAEVV